MKDLNEFEYKGWIKFEFDHRVARWAKAANSKITLKLKNKEISPDLCKKVFIFFLLNPFFSSLFGYKIIIKKIIQIYSSVKNMILFK